MSKNAMVAVVVALMLALFVILGCDENHAGMTPEQACQAENCRGE